MANLLKKLGLLVGLTLATLACNPYQKLENTVKKYKPADKIIEYKSNPTFAQCEGSYKEWNIGDSLKILVAEKVKDAHYEIPNAIEMKWKNNWGFCDYNKNGLNTDENLLIYLSTKDQVNDFIWSPQGKHINFSDLDKQTQKELKDSIRVNVNKVVKAIKK